LFLSFGFNRVVRIGFSGHARVVKVFGKLIGADAIALLLGRGEEKPAPSFQRG